MTSARRDMRRADAEFRDTARSGSLRIAPGPIVDKRRRESEFVIYVVPLVLTIAVIVLVALLP